MDKWTDRISNSTALAELKVVLSTVGEAKKNDPAPEQLDSLDRLDFVVTLILDRLTNADARLVSNQVLDAIGPSSSNLRSYLDTWKQGGGEEYLSVHSQNMADSILQQVAQIPSLPLEGADKILRSLRNSVNGHRLAVDRATASLEAEVSTVKQVFVKEAETADETVTQLDKNVDAIAEKIETLEAASVALTKEQQAAFSTSQTARSESFDELVTEKQKLLIETVDKMSVDVKEAAGEIKKSIQADEAASNEAKLRIERLLGIVGEEALIGSYSKSANEDEKQANFWRWVTVGSILIAILAAAGAALSIVNQSAVVEPNWYHLAAKTLLTFSFGGLAAYAGRQSGEHRRAQRDAKHMATQLAAVKPYLDDMDDPVKRDDLLREIAMKLFGQPAEHRPAVRKKGASKSDDSALLSEALAVIKAFVVKE